MRIAFVHYWLTTHRGGERVLESLCELYPRADIFTHVHDPAFSSPIIQKHRIQYTFIQKLPGAVRHYRRYLPLMPLALEQLDLRGYDLVISNESGPAKGVLTGPETLHLCYCFSPMRYLWEMYHDYRDELSPISRLIFTPVAHYLRLWDLASASRVDSFAAISRHVADRVMKNYRRPAEVIFPPVDVGRFNPNRPREDFYVALSHLVPYKKMDLIAETFTRLKKPLVLIGDGPERRRIQRVAGPNVDLLGRQSDEAVKSYFESCKAFVFAADEDFGIAPLEAQAAGAPVIAYGRGGVTETIADGETGLFFKEQTVESLADAITRFESQPQKFNPARLRQNAERFSKANFQRDFKRFVEREWERFKKN